MSLAGVQCPAQPTTKLAQSPDMRFQTLQDPVSGHYWGMHPITEKGCPQTGNGNGLRAIPDGRWSCRGDSSGLCVLGATKAGFMKRTQNTEQKSSWATSACGPSSCEEETSTSCKSLLCPAPTRSAST